MIKIHCIDIKLAAADRAEPYARVADIIALIQSHQTAGYAIEDEAAYSTIEERIECAISARLQEIAVELKEYIIDESRAAQGPRNEAKPGEELVSTHASFS